jgi:hypothetical protein
LRTAQAYWGMTLKQFSRIAKWFGEQFVADETRPLTAAERAQRNRLRRKRGRPKPDKDLTRVSVSIDKRLLD